MKPGDLIRVQYQGDEQWYSGIVIEVALPDNPHAFPRMYCTEREAIHILDPKLDRIELIDQIDRD
jgi:hypothetical protein